MNKQPLIAAVIGDPAGVGPEVCVQAAASADLEGVCRVVLIGEAVAVKRSARLYGIDRTIVRVSDPAEQPADPRAICVLDTDSIGPGDYQTGKPSAAAGRSVVEWIHLGERFGAEGRIDGLVLGPVDSSSLKLGGIVKDIDDLQPPDTFMFRISGKLRAVPITEHIRIRDIPATVTQERVLHVIRMVDEKLRLWGLPRPHIAVAGLNPHAMFEEDREQVAPAIEAARALGIDASGPHSPDSVFRLAMEGRYDAVVTMYHDQGQIAVKTTAFEGACTIYMGLPYVMLNVPHGTAFDIAGKGKAQHYSVLAAIRTAAALAAGKGFLAGA
jgi:4-phospho-D-threonate 3-dehydrogenase / 4-phospho-D-erythronate 3-dehydrogenase